MKYNQSQWRFWRNSIFHLSTFEELKAFVNNISLFLDDQADHLKENEPAEFEDEQSEAEYNVAIEQYEDRFPVLLCNSFIIVLVSILEQEMTDFCEALADVNHLEVQSSDIKGGFHQQFKTYVSKIAKLTFDFGGKQWNDIKGLIEVRNTIVHNNGSMIEGSRKELILRLNEQYPTLSIKGELVRPTIPFCNQMVDLVHAFLTDLTHVATERYK